MSLYGGMQIVAVTSGSAGHFDRRVSEGKKMFVGEFTPVSARTTFNTGMAVIDSVVLTFVDAPSGTHTVNNYVTSSNGALFISHTAVSVVASAMTFVSARTPWSRVAYVVVGSVNAPPTSTE